MKKCHLVVTSLCFEFLKLEAISKIIIYLVLTFQKWTHNVPQSITEYYEAGSQNFS